MRKLLDYANIPEAEDLYDAASELIRLQEFYKLYPHNITKGEMSEPMLSHFFSFKTSSNLIDAFISYFSETSLNADEAYHMGLVAYDEDKFQHAFLWFLYSWEGLTEYSTTTEEELLRFLSLSAYNFGSLPVAIYFGQWLLNLGETSKRQRALSCRYSTGGGNPRLMYAPVKEEVEWDEPRIIRYHDIISDREIEILKNISRPQLSRSKTRQGVTKDRTSQSVFLKEDNTVARISQNIADITGLSVESAEYLHVQNYGIGGRFKPHYDALMSDVEIGGDTVFPEVGVALKPKKGSAVFWYNLKKNGTLDLDTLHAGCPVLVGNKWLATKWIHEFGQEFRRPCSLSDWE
ncbi:unnamed protein product [Leuciscus chuanchicus]